MYHLFEIKVINAFMFVLILNFINPTLTYLQHKRFDSDYTYVKCLLHLIFAVL